MSVSPEIVPDAQWCAAHPLSDLTFQSAAALQRMHIGGVVDHVVDLVNHFNCAFRDPALSPAQLAALRDGAVVQRIVAHVEDVLKTYWSDGERHLNGAVLEQDFEPLELQALLLYYANAATLDDLGGLDDEALFVRLFRIVDVINLVHDACDFDAPAIETLGRRTRIARAFERVDTILARLTPIDDSESCAPPRNGWTERDLEAKLRCDFNQVLHDVGDAPLGWDAIERQDSGIVRGEFLYYAAEHRELYLRVLARIGRRQSMYENAIAAGLVVLGYLAPWKDYGVWRHLMSTCTYPGTACPMSYPIVAFVNFVAAWQYNDSLGHQFLEGEEIEVGELLWTRMPANAAANDAARAKLICSVLTYFTPLPRRSTSHTAICAALRDLEHTDCDATRDIALPLRPELEFIPPPPPPLEPTQGPREMAIHHATGLLVQGLRAGLTGANQVLVSAVREQAGRGVQLATSLIDAALASGQPRLGDELRATLAASEIPTSNRDGLLAYLDEREQEDDEYAREDERLWGAVAEAQAYLTDPGGYLAGIDDEVEGLPEIDNDPRALCDAEFLQDAFDTFFCSAEEMALSEADIDAAEQEGRFPSRFDPADDGGVLDLGRAREESYRETLPTPIPLPAEERLVALLIDDRKRTVGYKTAGGALKSLRTIVAEIEAGRRDLQIFKRGDSQFVRSVANASEDDNLTELPLIEVERGELE